eukprot:symbB.v1.2.013915.t2/scaffold987.1/size146359/5
MGRTVPHVIYEERIIEVPQVERRELIRHVPVSRVQVVDKKVPRHLLEITEKMVEVPTVLTEEVPTETLEVAFVETITEVPKVQMVPVPVEVPKVVNVQIQERVEEVYATLIEERVVEVGAAWSPELDFGYRSTEGLDEGIDSSSEGYAAVTLSEPPVVTVFEWQNRSWMSNLCVVIIPNLWKGDPVPQWNKSLTTCSMMRGNKPRVPDPQVIEAFTQVVRPVVEYVDKEVPFVVTEPVERLQEVMQRPLLEEVAIPIPQVLTYEAVRQTAEPSVEQSVRQEGTPPSDKLTGDTFSLCFATFRQDQAESMKRKFSETSARSNAPEHT